MMILHNLVPGQVLFLRAYSYKEIEFAPLENVFRKSIGEILGQRIDPDASGRMGREYEIKLHLIKIFEDYVGIRFFIDRLEMRDEGIPFQCRKLGLQESRNNCRTFYAEDLDRAKVKCSSVIAKEEGWFSGEAQEGSCEKRKTWW